jgi:regulator of sirC expression with transglutaminase-like and TPR domain
VIVDVLRSRRPFQEIAALEEASFPLDRAALILALEEYPDMDIPAYLRRLDMLAARVEVLIGMNRNPINIIESMNEILFVQEGLRGNESDYYDPLNSFLNQVMDRRLGIPISLSILYMEVARRISFPIDGIGFPGHFLVKHANQGRDIIIDTFDHGRILTLNDCQELLDKIHEGSVSMNAAYFQPMGKRAIITRMLYNLKDIYIETEKYPQVISVIEKILLLNPGILTEIRDRGLYCMQLGLFANALADFEFYLEQAIAPEDGSHVQKNIKILRDIVCAVN